jgi:hypothetical protein
MNSTRDLRIADILAEIRTEYLQNKSLEGNWCVNRLSDDILEEIIASIFRV